MALGLSEDQAAALLRLVPLVRHELTREPPTLDRQRDALLELQLAIAAADKAFARAWHLTDPVLRPDAAKPAPGEGQGDLGMALRRRLEHVRGSSSTVRAELDEMLEALSSWTLTIKAVIKQLPRKGTQKRRRVKTFPIKLIHDITPKLPLQGGKFVKIVRILYQVAGYSKHNPERAIRTYAASRAKLDRET